MSEKQNNKRTFTTYQLEYEFLDKWWPWNGDVLPADDKRIKTMRHLYKKYPSSKLRVKRTINKCVCKVDYITN